MSEEGQKDPKGLICVKFDHEIKYYRFH